MEGICQLQIDSEIIGRCCIRRRLIIEVVIRSKANLEIIAKNTDFWIQVNNYPIPPGISQVGYETDIGIYPHFREGIFIYFPGHIK